MMLANNRITWKREESGVSLASSSSHFLALLTSYSRRIYPRKRGNMAIRDAYKHSNTNEFVIASYLLQVAYLVAGSGRSTGSVAR